MGRTRLETQLCGQSVSNGTHPYNQLLRSQHPSLRPHQRRVNILLEELQKEQAANERGACLEALSAIMER